MNKLDWFVIAFPFVVIGGMGWCTASDGGGRSTASSWGCSPDLFVQPPGGDGRELTAAALAIGYECEFGCNYPDGEYIGWTEGPPTWRLTREGAMRWARRRERWHGQLDVPMAREEILL